MKFYSTEYFDTLMSIVIKYTLVNYDYSYLEAMHCKNRLDNKIDTIIVGSSHTMNGIVENNLLRGNNVINLSVSSQDLYFNYLHIKKAINEARGKIKRCVINLGYYMLYQDLSLGSNFVDVLKRTYYPLFGDTHHYVPDEKYDMFENIMYDDKIYSSYVIKNICEEWARGFFIEESSYYGSLKTREKNNILGLKKIEWMNVDENSKIEYAINRTKGHNRLKQHKETLEENLQIIMKITSFLSEHGIRPIFVIMPFTKYYNQYIDCNYKREIYQILDELAVSVDFLDMNDYSEIFEEQDFLDSDHLNLNGAIKATKLLNEFLLTIEDE